jgi:hypothetical protein
MELLVLARLSGPNKPPSETEIAKDFAKLVTPAASHGEWKVRVGELLAMLRNHGLVDARRRLTETGRTVLREALGVAKVPTWSETRNQLLPALAFGVEATSKIFADGEKLQAALIAKQLGLPTRATLASLFDDLVASELGLTPGKVTMDRIRVHLLARRAGVSARGKATDVARQVAASAVRAPRADAHYLRTALVRRWLADGNTNEAANRNHNVRAYEDGSSNNHGTTATTTATAHARAPATPAPLDDRAFAAMIIDAIHAIGTEGRFGPYKVFVSAIWRQLAHDPRCNGMTLDDLKQRLLDANRASLLDLARADLVAAMDRDEVATSEIADRGASFHFVLDARRLP